MGLLLELLFHHLKSLDTQRLAQSKSDLVLIRALNVHARFPCAADLRSHIGNQNQGLQMTLVRKLTQHH